MCIAIAHYILSAARPKSFLSNLLIGLKHFLQEICQTTTTLSIAYSSKTVKWFYNGWKTTFISYCISRLKNVFHQLSSRSAKVSTLYLESCCGKEKEKEGCMKIDSNKYGFMREWARQDNNDQEKKKLLQQTSEGRLKASLFSEWIL